MTDAWAAAGFFNNGNVKELGKVIDEKWHGKYCNYYESGNIREEKNYLNGILSGRFLYYYNNGKIKEDTIKPIK